MSFVLHPQLAADTLRVGRLDLCRVLLMNDSNYPWLILVPERPDIRETFELDDTDQATLWTEINRTAAAMQQHFGAAKMNIAALGNQVPQLHIHVIARYTDDPAWPKPVWGQRPSNPYRKELEKQRLAEISGILKLRS